MLSKPSTGRDRIGKALLIAGALIVATFGSVSAEDMVGVILAVDTVTRHMLLEGGAVVVVSESIPIKTLQPGQEVLVSFEENASGEKVATQVQLTQ